MATSVGGVVTGRGADIIIVDDPPKPDEGLSTGYCRTRSVRSDQHHVVILIWSSQPSWKPI